MTRAGVTGTTARRTVTVVRIGQRTGRKTMAEYIEREAALASIRHEDPAFAYAIMRIPVADVRPVVRGKWVKARGSWCTPGGDPVWECSECGKGLHVYGIEHSTYGSDVSDGQWVACPNCGADMRPEPPKEEE